MKMKNIVGTAVIAATLASMPVKQAVAAADPLLGEIMWVGYNFCPRGWANADGQLLSISSNTALFSLYGTIYGGDGRTTFALPDLRGRVPVHVGTGVGLSAYTQGSKGGEEEVTLLVGEMPAHNHTINASVDGVDNHAAGSILGSPKRNTKVYDAPANATTTLDSSAVSDTGEGEPHENRPPYLTLRACVAVSGIYPSRN